MGWQGCDPSTDFSPNQCLSRRMDQNSFQALLHKKEGRRAEWEYPFAVAGVNLSFMLMQMLDLQSVMPSNKAGIRFLELLGEDLESWSVSFH
ncbi:hypothetical protein ZIOFF_050715 [Zingiber officinale]|uniref:ELMO domain-containing protein n=1 Tax=Zingiber officinale TaxID=94328 RepID=A0A8J5FS12_ZINOF|nr:hypothetical protein ZIOFF_050715 [Zingiber officinale]